MKRFLALVIAVIVIFIVATVLIGKRTFEGLVVQKPYETGLQWDELRKQNEALGWNVSLSRNRFLQGSNILDIAVSDRGGRPLDGLAVTVYASRPSTAENDVFAPAEPKGQGRYLAELSFPVHGLWDIRIEARQGQSTYRQQERISVSLQQGAASDCEISRGPCRKSADGMLVVFEVLPRPVQTMKNLRFSVDLSEAGRPVADASVALDLTMPGMFMGRNRPALTYAGSGRYEGNGVIIRCPSGRKLWKASLQITRKGRTVPVEFLFEAS